MLIYRHMVRPCLTSTSTRFYSRATDLLNEAMRQGRSSASEEQDASTSQERPVAQSYPLNKRHNNDPMQAVEDVPLMDPDRSCVLLFPGQGAQFVGMGAKLQHLPRVKSIYESASEYLGYDLLQLCLKGPADELNKTLNCQLAVFVTSLAALESLKEQYPNAITECIATAGFSVGEYAALVFAGVLPFEDALSLLKTRAQLMQQCSEYRASGLLTVLGQAGSRFNAACQDAIAACNEEHVDLSVQCQVAIELYTNCKVLGGDECALRWIQANAAKYKLRPLKRIQVSGAFHTQLMASAERRLFEHMQHLKFSAPRIPVLGNYNGTPYPTDARNVADYKRRLCKQISSKVKWEHTLHSLFNQSRPFFIDRGIPFVYELGPGTELTAVMKRYNKNVANRMTAIQV